MMNVYLGCGASVHRMQKKTYLAKQNVNRKCSSWNVKYGYVAKKCSKLV